MVETWNPDIKRLTNGLTEEDDYTHHQIYTDEALTEINEDLTYLMARHGYLVDYQEADQGVAGGGFSVKDLVDEIGATKQATIFLPHLQLDQNTTTYTFSTDESIPSNIDFAIQNGALISVDSGVTLTFDNTSQIKAGAKQQVFTGSGTVTFTNGGSGWLYWWGIESATDDYYFAGDVGIGTDSPNETLHLLSSGEGKPKLKIENTNADSNPPVLEFFKNSVSQVDDDRLGEIQFRGLDSGDTDTEFARIRGFSSDVTDTDEGGELTLFAQVNGVMRPFINLNGFNGNVGQGEIIFNEESVDIDFRVESDNNANALFIQGSSGNVGIGTASPGEKLEVDGDAIITGLTASRALVTDGDKKLTSSSATAANLVTLTDDSMADTLHRHSELSANDGTPDANLTLDADGILTLTLNSDTIVLRHDGTDAHFNTSDGSFIFQTTEGTNTKTYVDIKGKGDEYGVVRIYDDGDDEHLNLICDNGVGYIRTGGTSPSGLVLQTTAHANVICFLAAASGETPEFKVYGYRAGDASRSLEIGVGVDADDTASFDGVSNYLFDGDIKVDNIIPDDLTASRAIVTDADKKLESSSATAANLVTLTDDSMADTLHRHSELSASDGTPDASLTLDADGHVSLSTDLIFTGAGNGLGYGSLYLHEGAANVDISGAGADTYVKVTGFDAGLMNNVSENSDAFNVSNTGVYKVDWQISADSQGNNLVYECDIFVNGVEQSDGSCRRKFGAAADYGSMSGTAILDITSTSHDIDLRIKEVGGAGTDIDIFNMNFNIVQLGGT